MVSLLLDHMADPTARTSQGLTPREYLYYVERFTGEKNMKIESALRGWFTSLFSFVTSWKEPVVLTRVSS
jgi:hypothetical protein